MRPDERETPLTREPALGSSPRSSPLSDARELRRLPMAGTIHSDASSRLITPSAAVAARSPPQPPPAAPLPSHAHTDAVSSSVRTKNITVARTPFARKRCSVSRTPPDANVACVRRVQKSNFVPHHGQPGRSILKVTVVVEHETNPLCACHGRRAVRAIARGPLDMLTEISCSISKLSACQHRHVSSQNVCGNACRCSPSLQPYRSTRSERRPRASHSFGTGMPCKHHHRRHERSPQHSSRITMIFFDRDGLQGDDGSPPGTIETLNLLTRSKRSIFVTNNVAKSRAECARCHLTEVIFAALPQLTRGPS